MRGKLLAGFVAVSLMALSGPAMAEETRDVSATYVGGTGPPAPGVYLLGHGDSGVSSGDDEVTVTAPTVGANTVAFAVEDGEEEVHVEVDDVGASTTEAIGPVCAHYTFHGEDDTHGNGVFAGETTLSVPAEADKVSISLGHSHDPGLLGQGWVTCMDQKATAGQVHASFS